MRKYFNNGYVFIKDHTHPKKTKASLVREHVLIVESVLGKYLPNKSCVHHVNGIRDDNRKNNLVLCQDIAYHFLIHQRTRAFYKCGNANWHKCCYCNEYDDKNNMKHGSLTRKNINGNYFHDGCKKNYLSNYRNKQRGYEVK